MSAKIRIILETTKKMGENLFSEIGEISKRNAKEKPVFFSFPNEK